MAIVRAELLLMKAQNNNDLSSNGGRMSDTEVTDGASANLFPRVQNAERLAGSTKFRKAFYKVASAEDKTLSNVRIYEENFTIGDDRIQMIFGDQINTQGDLLGSEDKFGAGTLDVTILSTATTLDIAVETGAGAENIFRDTMLCRISDKANIDGAGNESFFTISGVPTVLADVVTVTLAAQVGTAYAAGARISGVMEVASVVGTFVSFVVTSAAGLYNEITNPVLVDSIAGVEQSWTLTFTSGTAFDITGDILGAVGSGTIAAGGAPTNPFYGAPYFTLAPAGFSGTFLSGDTITFNTSPASVPVWLKRVVPAGSNSIANNKAIIVMDGESS